MAKIFISYRRSDSAAMCGRIYDRLVARFGRKAVFKDVDSIPAGVNFAQHLRDVLRQCDVELVIIGRYWLDGAEATGRTRLENPGDFVRLEVEEGLTSGMLVLPLLVDGAQMPAPEQLPPSLHELPLLNALPVRYDPDFEVDMRRVIAAVEQALKSPRRSRPSPALAPSTPAATSSSPKRGAAATPPPASTSAATATPTPAPASRAATVAVAKPATSAKRGLRSAPRGRLLAGGMALLVVALLASVLGVLGAHDGILPFGPGVSSPPRTCTPFSAESAPPEGGIVESLTASNNGGWVSSEGSVGYLHGNSWCEADTSALNPLSSATVLAIGMVPTTGDAWATGFYGASRDSQQAFIALLSQGKVQVKDKLTSVMLGPVAMDSQDDGWIGGTALLHFNGSQWLKQDLPAGVGYVQGIVMASANEGWAIGSSESGIGSTHVPPSYSLLHYTNHAWSAVTLPALPSGDSLLALSDIALQGNTVMMTGTVVGGIADVILSYDPQAGTLREIPAASFKAKPQTGDDVAALDSFSTLSPSDGWLVGNWYVDEPQGDTGGGLVLRDQNGTWAKVALPDAIDVSHMIFLYVAVSGSDVWVAGVQVVDTGGAAQFVLLHFDGATWNEVAVKVNPKAAATTTSRP